MTEVTDVQLAPDSTGTTGAGHGGNGGDSGSTAQTTGNGPVASADESFFDPASIQDKPELLAAYKGMQSAFTKRMKGIKDSQNKIEAYDRFSSAPVETLKQIAAQYGLNVIQPGDSNAPTDDFKSWDDVKQHFFKEFKKEMQPVLREVTELKQKNVEQHLDTHFPDWRQYEDSMMEKLQAHPSLVRDPDALYRAAVPQEVWEARAVQKAMAKLKAGGQNSQVSGGTATTRPTQQEPTGPLTFDQAVEVAKRRIAARG